MAAFVKLESKWHAKNFTLRAIISTEQYHHELSLENVAPAALVRTTFPALHEGLLPGFD